MGATYMDVAFPYKEELTNACGLIRPTTSHVASQSPIIAQRKSQTTKAERSINYTLW